MVLPFSSARSEHEVNERPATTFSIERRSSSCISESSHTNVAMLVDLKLHEKPNCRNIPILLKTRHVHPAGTPGKGASPHAPVLLWWLLEMFFPRLIFPPSPFP